MKLIFPLIISIVMALSAVPSNAAFVSSISQVDVVSNVEGLSGQSWRIRIVGGTAGTDEIIFTPVGQEFSGDFVLRSGSQTIERVTTLKVTPLENYCIYNTILYPEDHEVFEGDFLYKEFWTWESDQILDFKDSCSWSKTSQVGLVSWGVSCFKRGLTRGIPADIETPDERFSTRVTITPSGKSPESKVIGTAEKVSGVSTSIGENSVIHWLGNIQSGSQCPIADDEIAMFSTQFGNNWVVVDERAYNQYLDWHVYGGKIIECLRDAMEVRKKGEAEISIGGIVIKAKTPQDVLDTCADEYKKTVDNSIKEITSGEFGRTETIIEQGKGKLKIDIFNSGEGRLLSYPEFLIYMKAGWVGIKTTAGEPKILSASSEKFNEATPGNIIVNVKNIGDFPGSFELRANCQAPFSSRAVETFSLDGGESTTRNLDLTADSASIEETEICKSCEIIFRETIHPEQPQDTTTVSVCFEQKKECTKEEKFCSGDIVMECAENQLSSIEVENCAEQGKICRNGACIEGERGGGFGEAQDVNESAYCAGVGQTPTDKRACCPGLEAKSSGGIFGIGATVLCSEKEEEGFQFDETMIAIILIIILVVIIIAAVALKASRSPQRSRYRRY